MSENAAFLIFLLCTLFLCDKLEAANSKKSPMEFMQDFTSTVGKELGMGSKIDKTDDSEFMKKFGGDTTNRPTKCHVCRVLAQELIVEMNRTSDIKKSYWATSRIDGREVKRKSTDKKIDYNKSEVRITDILESVCNNVYNYRVYPGPPFPYVKGVKSLLRQALDEMVGSTGLPLNTQAPDEALDDPTSELRRLFYQCNHMVENYEDDIMDWYMNNQEEDTIGFLCAERILKPTDVECLRASTEIPSGFKRPEEEEERPDGKFSYKSQHDKEL